MGARRQSGAGSRDGVGERGKDASPANNNSGNGSAARNLAEEIIHEIDSDGFSDVAMRPPSDRDGMRGVGSAGTSKDVGKKEEKLLPTYDTAVKAEGAGGGGVLICFMFICVYVCVCVCVCVCVRGAVRQR